MNFGIFLSAGAAKFLQNLDKEDKKRIIEKLRLLENGPFSLPYKKIKGRENISHQDWGFQSSIFNT
jgi:mRNA-degrading endonuclease RelE of RelBE toxin-antitoxin system